MLRICQMSVFSISFKKISLFLTVFLLLSCVKIFKILNNGSVPHTYVHQWESRCDRVPNLSLSYGIEGAEEPVESGTPVGLQVGAVKRNQSV